MELINLNKKKKKPRGTQEFSKLEFHAVKNICQMELEFSKLEFHQDLHKWSSLSCKKLKMNSMRKEWEWDPIKLAVKK